MFRIKTFKEDLESTKQILTTLGIDEGEGSREWMERMKEKREQKLEEEGIEVDISIRIEEILAGISEKVFERERSLNLFFFF